MAKKEVIIVIGIAIVLIVGWYLISPLFITVEKQEESSIKDNFDSMDAITKADFEQQTEAMRDVVMEMTDSMPSTPEISAQGSFKARAHDVEGKALFIEAEGKQILRFEDFDTINGPNLHIYLSSGLGDDDIIDLGKIKATKGNVNYELDQKVDITKYNKVLVWCVPFGVLFSYAELQ